MIKPQCLFYEISSQPDILEVNLCSEQELPDTNKLIVEKISLVGDWRTLPPHAWTALHKKFAGKEGDEHDDPSEQLSAKQRCLVDNIMNQMETLFDSYAYG